MAPSLQLIGALADPPGEGLALGSSVGPLLFRRQRAKAAVAVETDQREAIVPLVLAGAGAAVVPKPMATVAHRQGAAMAVLHPALWRELGLVHRAATLSPAARAFIEVAMSPSA